MRILFLLLVFAFVGNAQSIRFTKLSPSYDVELQPGKCDASDNKCGPITVALFRKGRKSAFQTLIAGRLSKSDLQNSITFVDLDFDGIRDLSVFDGLTAPGGYATLTQRIYLYSKRSKRFVYNSELSKISRHENLGSFDLDKKRALFYTYARPGGGVFQKRGYDVVNGSPILKYETIDDTTFANGTRTKLTIRKLMNGRWRTWTRIYTGNLNL